MKTWFPIFKEFLIHSERWTEQRKEITSERRKCYTSLEIGQNHFWVWELGRRLRHLHSQRNKKSKSRETEIILGWQGKTWVTDKSCLRNCEWLMCYSFKELIWSKTKCWVWMSSDAREGSLEFVQGEIMRGFEQGGRLFRRNTETLDFDCMLLIIGFYLQHMVRCLTYHRFWVDSCSLRKWVKNGE